MTITSIAFQHNSLISEKYTCDGENINPPLTFSKVPKNTQSLVLIVDDPDAPSETFVHWVVFNIDPKTTGVEENSVPDNGLEGNSSLGKPGWVSPCPPPASQRGESGTHRYVFKLYALDTKLNLPKGTDKKTLEKEMENHILEKTEIIGLYKRE